MRRLQLLACDYRVTGLATKKNFRFWQTWGQSRLTDLRRTPIRRERPIGGIMPDFGELLPIELMTEIRAHC